MKAKKLTVAGLLAIIIAISVVNFNGGVRRANSLELPTKYPLVYVYPEEITVVAGDYFTISVVAYNLTNTRVQDPENPTMWIPLGNLYGFDIQFSWDPTVIKYVNHTVTVPVEDYPNPIPPSPYPGILHRPFVEILNVVDEAGNIPGAVDTKVRAWFSYASIEPAQVFNGNGTLFTMTFQAIKNGVSPLEIVDCTLAGKDGSPLAKHICNQYSGQWLIPPRNGEAIIGAPPRVDFTYWPDIGVANLPVNFTATVTGNASNVQAYDWDFGDGTQQTTPTPTVSHVYTESSYEYTVSLKVRDVEGIESNLATRKLKVVQSRDLKATSIIVLQSAVKPNKLFNLTARIENKGTAPFSFDENCTLEIYRNNTVIDPNNPVDWDFSKWIRVYSNWTLVEYNKYSPRPKEVTITLNSTIVFGEYTTETYYYFLLRVTGIPRGYEADITNNIAISNHVLYTSYSIIPLKITHVGYGYQIGRTYQKPLIEGEDATFECEIENRGAETVNFTLVFYLNSTPTETIQVFNVAAGAKITEIIKHKMEVNGNYNVSILVAGEGENIIPDVWQGWLRVIKSPKINVTVSNENPTVGQIVTFVASVNFEEPNNNMTLCRWKIFEPEVDPESGKAFNIIPGNKTISISFSKSGKWTVVFEISDSWGLAYNSKRPATKAYRVLLEVSVGVSGGRGFPVEWILVVLLIIVVSVALVVYRRHKKKVIPTSEEEG